MGGKELLRDQVARDHEEDVDPDEAAGEGPEAEVEQDDDHDRERSETIDVRAGIEISAGGLAS